MLDWRSAPASLPPDHRVYAIGDVHGCADKLAAMHANIATDLAERPVALPAIVHLGDYVDRGPDTAGVLSILAQPAMPAVSITNLRGNHEEMMLTALSAGDPGSIEHWMSNGGGATLRSWGVDPSSPPRTWAAAIPAGALDFLHSLRATHRIGPYLFVHAGVRPGVPWRWQSRHDLLWIRHPFLSWDGALGIGCGEETEPVVVHGHTPFSEPVVKGHRIGVDTGAVLGGPLTCAVLEADRLAFIST